MAYKQEAVKGKRPTPDAAKKEGQQVNKIVKVKKPKKAPKPKQKMDKM